MTAAKYKDLPLLIRRP